MKGGLWLLSFQLLFAMGCNKTPEGILPINKMKVVFLHHVMAEEMLNNFVARNASLNFDSARIVLFSGVMKLHKTDSLIFAKSIAYYKEDIVLFKELLDSVNALALREKEFRALVEAERVKIKIVADSIAAADSLAMLEKLKPALKDSLKDSLKAANKESINKKDSIKKKRDSVVLPPQ